MSTVNSIESAMERTCNRNLLKWHVGQVIFCPYCRKIMDCKRAVSLEVVIPEGTLSRCVCAPCYDIAVDELNRYAKQDGCKLTVLDGRVLFARPPRPKPVSFKVEVIADRSGKWCGNGLRFATRKEAKAYGADLASRWTLVEKWRVVGSPETINR